MTRWNYKDVACGCGKTSSIRVDQFNRKGGAWTCRTCTVKGRRLSNYGTGIQHDPEKAGAYWSYHRAKRRVKANHHGAYSNIEFRFNSFDEWFAELGPRPEGLTVDRINNEGHYEPGNVRWATMKEQNNNKGIRGRHQQLNRRKQ